MITTENRLEQYLRSEIETKDEQIKAMGFELDGLKRDRSQLQTQQAIVRKTLLEAITKGAWYKRQIEKALQVFGVDYGSINQERRERIETIR